MALIDLIILVLVVVVVVTRFTKFKLPKDLRDKAARRQDYDKLRGRPLVRDDEPKVVDITQVAEAQPVKSPVRKPTAKELMAAAKDLTGMAKIRALEPGFDEAAFVEGAEAAYRYFYTSWNAKDEDGLDALCAPGLYGRLVNELNDAAWAPVEVDSVDSVSIAEARVNGRTAILDVDFEATQREDGGVPKTVKSRWVLARPLGSEDPNWELQDMRRSADA